MLRLVSVLILVAVVVFSGCGVPEADVMASCPGMTAEKYSFIMRVLTFYLEPERAQGVSKSEFLDQLPYSCDDLAGYELLDDTMSWQCDCLLALYTAAANKVW